MFILKTLPSHNSMIYKNTIFSPLCLFYTHSNTLSAPDRHVFRATVFLLSFLPQLDEGCIKPRPGSDVSTINAPSPTHKVQWQHIMSSANRWGLPIPSNDKCTDLNHTFPLFFFMFVPKTPKKSIMIFNTHSRKWFNVWTALWTPEELL